MTDIKMNATQTAVLLATRQNDDVVPVRLEGIDPRAFGGAVSGLIKAGMLVACEAQDGMFQRNGESFQTTADGIAACPLPEDGTKGRFRGVMVASYHARYMAQGGGCADNIDHAMKTAFLTACPPDADTPKLDTAALKAWGEDIALWNPAWEIRNPGMQRMNLANRVRAAVRKGRVIELNGEVLTVSR